MSQLQRTDTDEDVEESDANPEDESEVEGGPPVAPNTDAAVVGEQHIDRQPGSGSLSKQEAWASESAQQRSASNDGRYDTRTTFYYNGDSDDPVHLRSRDRHQQHRDPNDRRSWSELAKWNDGMRDIDGSRKQQNLEADVRRWIQTFGNQLDCNRTQIQRTEYIVTEEIGLGLFNTHHLSAEKAILGALSLVVDSDTDTDDPEDFDLDDWFIYRDQFEQMMDDIDMDRDELWTVRKLVHAESELFS